MTDEVITQFTEVGREMYPGYICIKRREDGHLCMVVRTSGHASTSTMEMSANALRRMASEILAGIPAEVGERNGSNTYLDAGIPGGCSCGGAVFHRPHERPWCLLP